MDDTLAALGRLARMYPDYVAFSETGGNSICYHRLYATIGALARDYRSFPEVVGLLAPGGIAWVAASLALLAAGRTLVPLPDFFSDDQLDHVVSDAGIGRILTGPATTGRAARLAAPASPILLPAEDAPLYAPSEIAAAGRLVIYSSGSTGRPKGVCLGPAQLAYSASALARITGAAPGDTYLSVLPMALLLEQICAIHVPLLTGVRVVFGGTGSGEEIADLAERVQPTLMVLVPQLLGAWMAALGRSARIAPASLRMVAVGGAPVAAALADAAWRLGIPVYEGYGLSECCAVVTLNRPGDRESGTVGRPLDGIAVTLEDGEIVVHGPTVMDGYLDGGDAPAGVWRTGDLGALDPDGRLIVHGRRDSRLVTAAGRNVVPEWIEAMVLADARLAHCVLTQTAEGYLAMLLVPHAPFAADFRNMSDAALAAHVANLAAAAPAYARPTRCVVMSEAELRHRRLLTGNGRPRRAAIAAAVAHPTMAEAAR